MLYEPVGYIIEYELGALAVFFVVMLRYYSARRFPNQRNSLYSLILWASVADVVLDVASSLIIDNVFAVPLALTHIVNTAFYILSIVMLALMMLYTLALSGYIDKRRLKHIHPLLVPASAMVLLLLGNVFTNWFFYVDPQRGYVHSYMFVSIYITCFIYIVFTIIIVFRNRSLIRREEFNTIILFLFIVLASTIIQYFYPTLLLTGVAILVSVVLMFFTIQKPDTMLDTATKTFTSEAMLSFLSDRRDNNEYVQLCAVKIRNMSRINEILGVENGSRLLEMLGGFLREAAKEAWVFRMRSSCFVAITRKREDYLALKTKLDAHIGEPWLVNGTQVFLQASVCCVETEGLFDYPLAPEEAVNYLESAISQNERGSGRIVNIVYGAEQLEKIKRSSAVEAALRTAIEQGSGLELYFQPLWSVEQERFVSAEVLLRFFHPQLGAIPPDEFIEIAENNGLIMSIDEFVVKKACAFIREHSELRALGMETLEINLSALEFMQKSLPNLLSDIMNEYCIAPKLLCFEVTETAATESFELLRECMLEISRFGCSFALDDFGTGYANISQVITLPFSVVKLDKSMLDAPPSLLEDMVRMFARIGRKTVIEGIETQPQAEQVKSFGVDIIQGYYCARPMNESDFVKFIKERQS